MKMMTRQSSRFQLLISLVSGLIILLVLPHWGTRPMLIGNVLFMVYLGFTTDFTPGPLDPHGTLVKVGFICLIVIMVAVDIYWLFQHGSR